MPNIICGFCDDLDSGAGSIVERWNEMLKHEREEHKDEILDGFGSLESWKPLESNLCITCKNELHCHLRLLVGRTPFVHCDKYEDERS